MIKNTTQENIIQLIDNEKYTLNQLMAFMSAHTNELADSRNIFKVRNAQDAGRLLTLVPLLFPNEVQGIESFFREEIKDSIEEEVTLAEDSKLFWLSAFLYNPMIFNMAQNWCSYLSFKTKSFTKNSTQKTFIFPIPFVIEEPLVKHYKAAATVGFKSFGEKTELNNIGTLEQLGCDYGTDTAIQFRLTKKAELQKVPFRMTIHFETIRDNKNYVLQLINNQDSFDSETIRTNPLPRVDFTHGIKICSIEISEI